MIDDDIYVGGIDALETFGEIVAFSERHTWVGSTAGWLVGFEAPP